MDYQCRNVCGGLGIYSTFKFSQNEILNDLDWKKINLYRAIQENPRELIIQARSLAVDQVTFDRLKNLSRIRDQHQQ